MGDAIEPVRPSEEHLPIADVVRLFAVESRNRDLLRRAVRSSARPLNWQEYFAERLEDNLRSALGT